MISMEKYEISYISNRKHLQIKSHFCISKEELSLRQSRKLEKEGFCWILSIVPVQLLCFKYNNFYLKLFFFLLIRVFDRANLWIGGDVLKQSPNLRIEGSADVFLAIPSPVRVGFSSFFNPFPNDKF